MIKSPKATTNLRSSRPKPDAPKRISEAVLVLGMHRSGTSAITGTLTRIGFSAPKTLLKVSQGNPRGYFESPVINAFHDEMLASAGSKWNDWRPFNPAWFNTPLAEAFEARAKPLLADEYGGAATIVLKDPRICRFVPFWLKVFADEGIAPRILIPVRLPLEVAHSLKTREGFPLNFGLLMWLRHLLDAEAATRNLPRVFLQWDAFLSDWRKELQRGAAHLGVTWPALTDMTAAEVDAFVSSSLKRERSTIDEAQTHPDMHEWVMETYAALLRLCGDPADARAMAELDDVRRRFDDATRLFGRTLADAELSMAALRADIDKQEFAIRAEREAELAAHRAQLAERDEEGLRREAAQAEAERISQAARLELEAGAASAVQAAELRASEQVAEVRAENQDLARRLAAAIVARDLTERQSRSYERQIGELEQSLQLVTQSTSWRAMGVVRSLAARLPEPVRRTLRRSAKAAWWAATPHLTLQRMRFLRDRRILSDVSQDSPVLIGASADVGIGVSNAGTEIGCDASREGAATVSVWNEPVLAKAIRVAQCRAGDDILIFVAYAGDGRLTALHSLQIQQYKEAGFKVALVVNSNPFHMGRDVGPSLADWVIVRQNFGFDFGAWKHAAQSIGNLRNARTVSFTNDSVILVRPAMMNDYLERLQGTQGDIVFFTENMEIRHHFQSYFFSSKSTNHDDIINIIDSLPLIKNKNDVIFQLEIGFAERIRSSGLGIATLFPNESEYERNPTIHQWEALLERGFPFLKVQLFTAGLLSPADARLSAFLSDETLDALKQHLVARSEPIFDEPFSIKELSTPAFAASALFNQYGATQASNLAESHNLPIVVPLIDVAKPALNSPVLFIIHCFYVDAAAKILARVERLAIDKKIVLTTDTEEKKQELLAFCRQIGLEVEMIVCRNQGRDVAPFLVEGRKYIDNFEFLVHLHTKKSLHDSRYASWGDYVTENLIFDTDTAESILHLLSVGDVGLVYSEHYEAVRDLRNWGYDYPHAKHLADRLGIALSADNHLEFPTSTMFWARVDALKPLFDLGLDYSDFEEEAGQIDGTLAHAIERLFLFVVESSGYDFRKVVHLSHREQGRFDMRLAASDLKRALLRGLPSLLARPHVTQPFRQNVGEVYPVGISRSRNERPRFSLLLPTARPENIYGGISSAIDCARKILNHIDGADIRVVVTSDHVDRRSLDALADRFEVGFTAASPTDDVEGNTVVCLPADLVRPLSMRASDILMATAWWTHHLGKRLQAYQAARFGRLLPMLYLVQDFEPGFYQWGTKYGLAEATYLSSADDFIIVNSEELSAFMQRRYIFNRAWCFPYEMNRSIGAHVSDGLKAKRIIVYGRPSVERNCFATICEGLRLWQAEHPTENCKYEIVFAGEEFNSSTVDTIENAKVAGKLSLPEYGVLLSSASIGISLMISPHPSYPPLEMASAGCLTITNRYENKDLSKRSDRIINVDEVSPAGIARALALAVKRIRDEGYGQTAEIGSIDSPYPVVDYEEIADQLMAQFRTKSE